MLYTFDILQMMVQDVVDDPAIDLQVIMSQSVSKTNHPKPLLFEVFGKITGGGEKRRYIPAAVDLSKLQISHQMVSNVRDGLDAQLQKRNFSTSMGTPYMTYSPTSQ
jgi:hypothetical protein